jgi:hypothetical protein
MSDIFSGTKYGLNYRLVKEEDAEFIIMIRTNQRLSRFIHATQKDINKQKEWIKGYKEREKIGKEYYYIFEDKGGISLGVSRIYNICKNEFTHGSWVFSPTAQVGCAVLGDVIVREIGFELLSLEKDFFDVRKKNIIVLKYNMGYNPSIIKEDELNIYFQLDYQNFKKGRQKYVSIVNNSR